MSNKSPKLYVGFTDDIAARVIEHKKKLYPRSFTARYVFDMLVWYEEHSRVVSTKMREKDRGRAAREEAQARPRRKSGLGRLEFRVAGKSWMESGC